MCLLIQKNDNDLYMGIHKAMNHIEISEIGHIRSHRVKAGVESNHIEKLNILADKLALKAIEELEASELE